MTQRTCSAELIVDIHKSSLQHLKEGKTTDQHNAQATYYFKTLFGNKSRFQAFKEHAMKAPIECANAQSFPSEVQVSEHIDGIIKAFNGATFNEVGLAPPTDQQGTDLLFPSNLATAPTRLGDGSTLSCLHWEWNEDLGQWVLVPNRDLIATQAGTELAPMHKAMSDAGAQDISASVRIVLHIGAVI